ncbi:MAG: MBL fold metallo-hydrolase [Chitinivibrionales bacterium]|nr:MBL fold metallo-hydrolase [Chitinivibrionales bacterium]
MKIRYWGVRGSVPVPGPSTVKYGGNTSCVSVEVDDTVLIFDSGTGIRECGNYLMSLGKKINGKIFISHTHWDHIQGFPFFVPAYVPGNTFEIFGPPSDVQNLSLEQIMAMQTNYEYFPIRISQLGADITYNDCREGTVNVNGFEISTCRLNHPVACLAYRLNHDGKTFIYGGDHEPYRNVYRDSKEGESMDEDFLKELDENAYMQNNKIAGFCRKADIVSWDAQYNEEEYKSKRGWGHSTYEANIAMAQNAKIKKIIFSHHEPMNSDEKLAQREQQCKEIARQKDFELEFSREGMEIDL